MIDDLATTKATIITSHWPIEQLSASIGDAIIADVIMDRLPQKNRRIASMDEFLQQLAINKKKFRRSISPISLLLPRSEFKM
jgi:hypothetical protein